MEPKVRCIYIDGMENTGKTSVLKELKKALKLNNKEFIFLEKTDLEELNRQKQILQENPNTLILKENSLLSVYYEDLKNFNGIKYVQSKNAELITLEQHIQHQVGSVFFFLIPEDQVSIENRFNNKEIPNYYNDLLNFYKGISQTSLVQGLDVKLIPFNELDRIYDIKNKILQVLNKDYSFNLSF